MKLATIALLVASVSAITIRQMTSTPCTEAQTAAGKENLNGDCVLAHAPKEII